MHHRPTWSRRARVASTAAVLVLPLVLAACGGGGGGGGGSAASVKSLRVLDYYNNEPDKTNYANILNACGKQAGVTIQREAVPGDSLIQKVLQQSSSKTLPEQFGFTFDRSGIRIPTLAISAWIPERTVVNDEHRATSLISTLRQRWNLGTPFTERDAHGTQLQLDLHARQATRPSRLARHRRPTGRADGRAADALRRPAERAREGTVRRRARARPRNGCHRAPGRARRRDHRRRGHRHRPGRPRRPLSSHATVSLAGAPISSQLAERSFAGAGCGGPTGVCSCAGAGVRRAVTT
jgi:hypothetical protein